MPILCIASEKGGVGKTTTTANLAAVFARSGPTVVIDLDPQANLTSYFGATTTSDTIGAADLLNPHESVSLADALTVDVAPNIDLIAAVRAPLQATERALAGEMGRETYLHRALAGVTSIYDWVLIDTPPNTGVLVQNGLIAADAAIAVSDMDGQAAEGAATIAGLVAKTADLPTSSCVFLGVLWTRVKANRELNRYIEADTQHVGLPTFTSRIHERAAIQKAKYQGRTIVDLAPSSESANEFVAVAQEATERLNTAPIDLTSTQTARSAR